MKYIFMMLSMLFLAVPACVAMDADAFEKWEDFVSTRCSVVGTGDVKTGPGESATVEISSCPNVQACPELQRAEKNLLKVAGYELLAEDEGSSRECMFMVEEQQSLGSLSEFVVVRYTMFNGKMFRLQTRKQAQVGDKRIPLLQSLYQKIQQINIPEKFLPKKK